MEVVLGVSMAPSTVRMVLIEGENADGPTVDQDNFEITPNGQSANVAATDQVISAILGTREGAAEGGYHLAGTGVTWSDEIEAAALREALAARKIENVMLVSAFLASAALAQAAGNASNYAKTALLFIEPDNATLAVVDCADGSVSDVHRLNLPEDDDEAVAELAELVGMADVLEDRPESLFVVGSGVDVPLIKPALETATSLPVNADPEPDTALARGAALASANAPLFASSTAALAYAQDPGTGEIDPYAVAPGYLAPADDGDAGEEALAYSAVPDEDAEAYTQEGPDAYVADEEELLDSGVLDFRAAPDEQPSRKPFLTAMSAMAIFVVGVIALVLALALSIRPSVSQRPDLGRHVVAPAKQAPAPVPPKALVPAPAPAPPKTAVPAPAPAPAPAPPPVRAPAPAPAPVPRPVPAPAPAPPPPPPPLPIPPVLPQLGQLLAPRAPGPPIRPWGGDHGGDGWGHGDDDGGFVPGIRLPLPIPGLHLGIGF